MKTSAKKRGAVLAVVSLMMCVAVYLNWSYSKGGDGLAIADSIDTSKTLGEAKYVGSQPSNDNGGSSDNNQNSESSADNYFSKARLTRQQARDQAISILKQTAENDKASETDKEKASAEITKLASEAVKESRVENLVKAKGYSECVAIINDSGISVIIPASQSGLTASDAAKIKDIAASETSLGSEKIKIIEAVAS